MITLPRSLNTDFYSIGAQFGTFNKEECINNFMQPGQESNLPQADTPMIPEAPSSYIKKIRVISLAKGKGASKRSPFLFYGTFTDFVFYPNQFCWSKGSILMHYFAKLGRELLRQRSPPCTIAETKWTGMLPTNFHFQWKLFWDKMRACKKSTLIQLLWHQGIAVNVWRHKINEEFKEECCFCLPQVEETILHCFWHCSSAQRVWDWATLLLNKLRMRRSHPGPQPAFNYNQIIFTDTLPDNFKKFKSLWPLLKGTCMWTIWTQYNERIFANSFWSDEKVYTTIWIAMLEYGCLVQSKTRAKVEQSPRQKYKLYSHFDRLGSLARSSVGDLVIMCYEHGFH